MHMPLSLRLTCAVAASFALPAFAADAPASATVAPAPVPASRPAPTFSPAATRTEPNLVSNIERPLRYRPEGGDFVIENGTEFFNRPLYGGNTGFRVDGGDRPEFVLYLPGRGGNIRLGLRTRNGTKWLHDAARIVTRYRPGGLLHEIRDPLLGEKGVIRLTSFALHQTEGFILRADPTDIPHDTHLLFAYGGVTGERGRRDGDIGTESVPISQYFKLRPEFARENNIEIAGTAFRLRARIGTLVGVLPADARVAVGDANYWDDPATLTTLSSGAFEMPVAVGHIPLISDKAIFLSVQRAPDNANLSEDLDTYRNVTAGRPGAREEIRPIRLAPVFRAEELPQIFANTAAHFEKLRAQVSVETPDPYLNAAVAALNVAADAVWDEPQSAIMHGAIAWRTKLLGWRGPYALDALGWHDRMRKNLLYWAGRQNTDPIPDKIPPPDENANLARAEAAIHSNGDLSNSHYDMNTVYIDALFRHLLWTGDLDFARAMWPVIERHLAWERRLFRREFGPEKLPLYEAYAVIWASDDLQYHGGGVAHSSAYQLYHNKMAARLARLLGHDATSYEREAELIARAMREHLWLPEHGTFAEFKDTLGLQRAHASAALWTIYHTIDSEVTTPREAWLMTEYVDRAIPHLPVRGAGVPEGLYTLSTTNWMPYAWSINNVVMAEVAHTALAFWQAGRADEAARLLRGPLLAAMYMGISPGNVGSMSYHDVYRRESQRDFADGSGVFSRALVEGLFGVKPDALAGQLRITPGFPAAWDHARMQHPDITLAFKRADTTETYTIESRLPRTDTLAFALLTRGGEIESITVNDQRTEWKRVDAGPASSVELRTPLQGATAIVVKWSRLPAPTAMLPAAQIDSGPAHVARAAAARAVAVPQNATWDTIDLTSHFNDRVTQIFKNEYRTPRVPASLGLPKQGIGGWAGGVNATAEIDDSGLRAAAAQNGGRVTLPGGLPFATPGATEAPNIVFTSLWDNYPDEATIPLSGRARHASLLMAGSTNWMQCHIDNGEVLVTYTDGSTARLALENPTTWWPIDQDYFIDDYQFAHPGPLPTRLLLKSGAVGTLEMNTFKGRGRKVAGGAATVLHLSLDPNKELRSLTVRALSNEVVIGLMAVSLAR
jgi:hypothetical protein